MFTALFNHHGTNTGENCSMKTNTLGTGSFIVLAAPKGMPDDVIARLEFVYMSQSIRTLGNIGFPILLLFFWNL